MKIVFMGTPEFAIPSLQKIYSSTHILNAVVTQPDKPSGRGQKVIPSPVKFFAQDHKISPVFQPISLKDESFVQQLRAFEADIFVVVAFRILPEMVFTIPRLGTINLHPSLLPKYRGAAPINWTIIQGETVTGITIIRLSKDTDAGGIILQETLPVFPDETAGELHDRLSMTGAALLVQALDLMHSGHYSITPQDDSAATAAPKLQREKCHISFRQPAEKVKNWIHGLSPYPTAFVYLNEERINLYKALVISSDQLPQPPGTVLAAQPDRLEVACEPGAIRILELQKEGKKRLPTAEFLRGFAIKAGEGFS